MRKASLGTLFLTVFLDLLGFGLVVPFLPGVARAHGATPAQVRIAWTLSRGPHVLAIPGTGDLDHLAENVAAGALQLSADELASLE